MATTIGTIGAFLVPVAASAVTDPGDTVFISEIHYDNDGTDAGEAVEVFGPAGTDLTGWSIVRYNGSGGAVYTSPAEVTPLPAVIPDLGDGYGVVVLTYEENGLQNGAPDGLALVDATGAVVQFLSYEGSFTGVGGPADGLVSTDIGVAESSTTPIGHSLQLAGTGTTYGHFTWQAAAEGSFGALGPIVIGDPVDPPDPDLYISELHYDNDGTDENEAVEVTGPAGTDLAGWSIVLYNGSPSSLAVYDTIDMTGTIDDEADGMGAVSFAREGIQNGAPDGLALVDPDGQVVEFLSYEGSFTAVGGPADGLTSSDIGVAEGSGTLADQSLQRSDGNWGGPFCNSMGDLNVTDPAVTCTTDPGDPELTMIHDIQGNGLVSPMLGQRVIIEGVVVGDEEGPAPAGRGFFVQEEDTDVDADPATSEGIFVFNFNNDDVDVGDVVRVEGTVAEFDGMTQLTDFVVVEVLDVEPRVATPVTVEFPLPTVDALEAVEGMAAVLPQELVISEYFNFDRFGEIVVALPAPGEDRPFTPTALFHPDSDEAAARLDLNERSRITVDDAISGQNPDAPMHPINRQPFTADNFFRGGDQVTGLTGPITQAFGLYRIIPQRDNGYAEYVQTQRPGAPDEVGGDVRVASLNALNYFITINDGTNFVCGPNQDQECRGADTAEELDRQRAKLVETLLGLDADVIGLNEVENRPGSEPLADLVDALNAVLGAGTYDYVAAGDNAVVGTDAIKVGLVYRPGRVTLTGDIAVLDTPEFLDPTNRGENGNRAAVAASFVENASGEVFSVVVNHLKSKGSPCGAGDDHPLAGSCNLTRTLAAGVLADWLDSDPTGVADDDWMVIGDLNSYDHEDPIGVLEDAGFTDLVKQYAGEYAYSYVFDGMSGYLDYAMASGSLHAQVTGATEWHINADESDVFDYDMSFKSPAQVALFDPTTPYRSSDHDAVLVGLDLDGDVRATLLAVPPLIIGTNHQLRPVTVLALGNRLGLLDSTIVEVSSSEADSGLGRGDRPDDIQIVDDRRVRLRAESFTAPLRTYTVTVAIQDGGQVVYDTTEVYAIGLGNWFPR